MNNLVSLWYISRFLFVTEVAFLFITLFQLTWIPFELKGFSFVINTMLERAQNPRGAPRSSRLYVRKQITYNKLLVNKKKVLVNTECVG